MTRILLADDEPDLLWALQNSLAGEGYELCCAHDGIEALAAAHRYRPDLIVLDVIMPRMDGLQVCHQLRQDAGLNAVLILILTVCSEVGDCIKGLNTGADDYLTKPFDIRELKARIRALLRRSRVEPQPTPERVFTSCIQVGPIVLDLSLYEVCVGSGNPVPVTPVEADLLYCLMLNPGQVFSVSQLLQQVWGYEPCTVTPGLVRWHIRNLRAKIEPDPVHPIYLRTRPRHGYVLSA